MFRDESPEAYETLRKLTSVPFAVGEEFASKWQFLPFIERGLHQYCRVDLGNVGVRAIKVPTRTALVSHIHPIDFCRALRRR